MRQSFTNEIVSLTITGNNIVIYRNNTQLEISGTVTLVIHVTLYKDMICKLSTTLVIHVKHDIHI